MEHLYSISAFSSFFAGVVSFFSPCTLPLVPAFLLQMAGSIGEGAKEGRTSPLHLFFPSLFFVLGFSVVFVTLGATASYIGQWLLSHLPVLIPVAGVLVIVVGLSFFFSIPLPFTSRSYHLSWGGKGSIGAFLLGVSFSLSYTPCISPVLGGVLFLASSQETISKGVTLLAFYSIGLGFPFLIASLFFLPFQKVIRKVGRYGVFLQKGSGLLLILLGVLLLTGNYTFLFRWVSFL